MTPSSLDPCFAVSTDLVSLSRLSHLQERLFQNTTPEQRTTLTQLLQGDRLQQWHKVLIGSAFTATQLCDHPDWLLYVLENLGEFGVADFKQGLPDKDLSTEEWERGLRLWRNRHMTRLIWRDFNRLADTRRTVIELTTLAELAIQTALD